MSVRVVVGALVGSGSSESSCISSCVQSCFLYFWSPVASKVIDETRIGARFKVPISSMFYNGVDIFQVVELGEVPNW